MEAKDPMVQLAESTALLSLLQRNPEKARSNLPDSRHLTNGSRQLSFNQEREICTALAFLAGISDNPNHVMAVAVEEAQSPKEIHVKIAINKSKLEENEKVLKEVEQGFSRIFHVLSRVGNVDSSISVDQVFREVISFCRQRILNRLRSRKACLRKFKPPLLSLFRSVIQFTSKTPNLKAKANFISKATRLLHTLEVFEEMESGAVEEKTLRRVVKEIRQFMGINDLERVLVQINQRKAGFDPSIGRAVVDEFSKLAQYRVVTRTLYKKAKVLEIFRSFRIDTIRLSPNSFHNVQTRVVPDLSSVLREYQISNKAQEKLAKKYQGQGSRYTDLAGDFSQIVTRTINSGKIHAEVQIMSYYEESKTTLRPRVIASTKDACFLCNALCEVQGHYHLPRTHGNLYPGWLLPTNLLFSNHQLPQKLDESIRRYTKNIIGQYAQRKTVRIQNHNESTIFHLQLSMSSLVDSVLSAVESVRNLARPLSATSVTQSSGHSEKQSPRPESNIPQGINDDIKSSSFSFDVPRAEASSTLTIETLGSSDLESKSSREIKGDPTQSTSIRLSQGKTCAISLLPYREPMRIHTDFLELFIGSSGKHKASSPTPDIMSINIEWLSSSAVSKIDSSSTYNVHSLPTETGTTCKPDSEILLRAGDQIVRLQRQ